MKLVAREEKVMFYGVPTTSESGTTYTYKRMQGFTDMSKSHNPVEYNRRYVDEKAARTNVVAYKPSIGFGFDQILDNDVHEDMVGIIDGEKINEEATRPLIMVDLTTKTGDAGSETYTGYKRDFSIIPSSEGDSTAAAIAGVAESAGQLGIEVNNIDKFTKTMIKRFMLLATIL